MLPHKFPKPPTDEYFEELVRQIVESDNPDAVVQLYGRSGQRQFGFDVIARFADGTFHGFQCKNTMSLTQKSIEDEIRKTEGKRDGLTRFVFYTSAPRDTKAQDAATAASAELKLPVVVEAWDRIERFLATHYEIAKRYLGTIPTHAETAIYVGYVRVAFDRSAFIDQSEIEWSHQQQHEAIKNVGEFFATGFLERRDPGSLDIKTLPASAFSQVANEITKIKSVLNRLKRAVVPSAQAEQRGDWNTVVTGRDNIDKVRRELMVHVNQLLREYGEQPIEVY